MLKDSSLSNLSNQLQQPGFARSICPSIALHSAEMASSIVFAQVDAFTDHAFGGNPAAICLLSSVPSPEWMQNMAAELNQSETAFLLRKSPESSPDSPSGSHLKSSGEKSDQGEGLSPPDNEYFIWWFTPFEEKELCGHATLASAHLLFSEGYVSGDSIIFYNHTKILRARRISHDGGRVRVELDFPLNPAVEVGKELWPMLAAGLGGVGVLWAGKSELDYLVVLPTAAVVQNLKPNWPKMKEISSRGVIATALVGPDDVARDETLMSCDFVSRFFGAGFDDTREDPVTGSAHCTSAPYWAKIIRRDSLKACQVSSRVGKLKLECFWDSMRVRLQGTCVTVIKGNVVLKEPVA